MNQEETRRMERLAEGTRGVYTFAVLFHGCNHALKLAQEREEGVSITACPA